MASIPRNRKGHTPVATRPLQQITVTAPDLTEVLLPEVPQPSSLHADIGPTPYSLSKRILCVQVTVKDL